MGCGGAGGSVVIACVPAAGPGGNGNTPREAEFLVFPCIKVGLGGTIGICRRTD